MDRILALQNLAPFTLEGLELPTKSGQSNGCSTVSSNALISSCSNVCPSDPPPPTGLGGW